MKHKKTQDTLDTISEVFREIREMATMGDGRIQPLRTPGEQRIEERDAYEMLVLIANKAHTAIMDLLDLRFKRGDSSFRDRFSTKHSSRRSI